MPPSTHALPSRVSIAVAVAAIVLLGGCRQRELAAGVTDSAFVATMAELERLDRTPGLDSLARANARARALQGRGLTRAQLEEAAGALADDPKRALALFREIERRASGDTTARADTAPATPGMFRRRR